jgi:acetyltransferase-like isoleucine patch superfamily enzyme
MKIISPSVVLHNPDKLKLGNNVTIMDFAVIGLNNYYQDIFDNDGQRNIIIGDNVRIFPWVLIYEGAIIESNVILEERTTVGSRTIIGKGSRIVYQAQVNDNVTIGHNCIIGGFIADNCTIGNHCSIFGALVHRYDITDTTVWDEVDEPGPKIKDFVVIGWGAVIVGNITIGESARIPPNSVVTRDVPARTIYAGHKR